MPDLSYNPEGKSSAESALKTAGLTTFPFLSRNLPYSKIQQWMLSVQHQVGSRFCRGGDVPGIEHGESARLRQCGFPGARARERAGAASLSRLCAHQNYSFWERAGLSWRSVKLEQRPWRGLSYLVAYTFSKAIDQGSTLNVSPVWVDPFNYHTATAPPISMRATGLSAAY